FATTRTMKSAVKHEETVFDAARKVADPIERRAFLDRACAGDAALRARVEELLAIKTDAESFFAEGNSAWRQAAADAATAAGAPPPGDSPPRNLPAEEQAGSRIGPYKLLQKIGEGGCGAVYMAEQEKPVRRRVALKIIKLGMDTKAVIARFEAERQ